MSKRDRKHRDELRRLRLEHAGLVERLSQTNELNDILASAYEQLRTVRDGGVEPNSGDVPPALMSAGAYEEWIHAAQAQSVSPADSGRPSHRQIDRG